ncbi:unnamed protein product [Paramecium pentaurelia]|uniref:Transmembrane protein n=1 Tax=Paramecium pentaurelia TaxID=43138 RepID=A0A8S1TDH3_9CILI|nr:unnamed protein product [Paramecium pentaurelia]
MLQITQKLIKNYLDLMTASPKIQLWDSLFKGALLFQFILRTHFIFPKDGWNVWKYSDFKLNVPYILLSYLYHEISDTIKIILILFNISIFILSFFRVQLVFYYNNLLWKIFYIPQVAMLAYRSGSIELSIIGVIILFSILTFNLYFNRSTKFIHSNPFIRKFTQLTIINVILDTICLIDFEFHLFQQIMLLFQGVSLCLDVIMFKPYRLQYNKLAFQYNFLYSAIVLLNSISLITKSEENMFYFTILFGTLAYALSYQLYDRKADYDSQNQFQILIQCQEFYDQEDILHYIKVMQHKNSCKILHKNQNKIDIVICQLENKIVQSKRLKLDYEILELALIHFLCIHKAPLTALCRLKQYYNIHQDHSMFFKIVFPSLHNQLWTSVTKVQENINQINKAGSYQDDRILSTRDIYEAIQIRDNSIPMIISTIDYKLNYWRQLISLINNFKRLFYATSKLSQKIVQCQQQLELLYKCKDIEDIEQPRTVIEVIILLIYYAIIVNDYQQAIKMQKVMNDILRTESLAEGKLLNGNIMENKICLLYSSIVKSQGQIVRINTQQIAQFWGYENEMDFRDIKHINQLMPDFLALVHDQYLERFKKLGHSILFGKSRTVFLKGKNNFFIPADITIDNFFISYDDYIITAAFSKTKEKCLFLLFDSKGKILGANHLMFKLLSSIDKTITQDQLTQGYIFQLIPKIFVVINAYKTQDQDINQENNIVLKIGNPIKGQFQKLMKSSKGKSIWTTYDTHDYCQVGKEQQCNIDFNHYEQIKPDCELFDEGFQERMLQYVDDSIQTTNYKINCYLEYLVLGYYKSIPLFTLEINDIITQTIEENNEEINSEVMLQNMELSDLNKSSHQVLSSIQNESFQKVKIEENDKLQQYPEVSLIRGKYDQSFFDQLQDSSRQILAPFSQRATFNLIKHKSINDDSKYLEDDFKIIKQQQELSYDQHNNVDQFQYCKHKTVLDQLQEKQSSEDKNYQINNQQEIQAVNSAGSIARRTKNHNHELLKQKSRSKVKPIQLSLILLIDLLIVLSIIIFNIFTIITLNTKKQYSNNLLIELQAPFIYNNYYCELTSHDIIFKLAQIQGIEFSEDLLDTIKNRFNNIQYLQNMSKFYQVFSQIEEEEENILNSNISLYYIDSPDIKNMTFTYFYNQIKIFFQLIIQFYQEYNINNFDDYFFQQSLFETLNLNETSQLFRLLLRQLIDKFYDHIDQNDEFIINLFIIQTVLQFSLILIQFLVLLDLLKIYRKIIHLNCRLYEKDVLIAIQRLQAVRDILFDKYSLNWKKADYVHIIYQPLNEQQTKNGKQNKTTLLSSRLQQQNFNIYTTSAFLLILLLIILLVNIGGFLLNSQKQKQLKPSFLLTAEFHHFTLQVDSIVSNAMRIKSQNIILSNNSLTNKLNPKILNQAINYFKIEKYQNLSEFKDLVKSFQQSQIQIISILIKDPNIDPKKAGILNEIFFQDLCPLICPNSSNIKDNCTYLYNKGIIGIYTKMSNFLTISYNYELEMERIDPDFQASLEILNSVDFNQIFGRYFTNTKIAFEKFGQEILDLTMELIEDNFDVILIYYSITGCCTLMIVGLALIYFAKMQQQQINLLRLSLTVIPLELIDQQAINILRQL